MRVDVLWRTYTIIGITHFNDRIFILYQIFVLFYYRWQ